MDIVQSLMGEISLGQAVANTPLAAEMDSLKDELTKEQENAALSAKQKGQKPRHCIPCMLLLFSHNQSVNAQRAKKTAEGMIELPRTLITNEYQPSHCDFINLRPIVLKDLLVETVHSDCYIVFQEARPKSFLWNSMT